MNVLARIGRELCYLVMALIMAAAFLGGLKSFGDGFVVKPAEEVCAQR